jgi:RNA polymerase sigma-70 factor, ECF subfamily
MSGVSHVRGAPRGDRTTVEAAASARPSDPACRRLDTPSTPSGGSGRARPQEHVIRAEGSTTTDVTVREHGGFSSGGASAPANGTEPIEVANPAAAEGFNGVVARMLIGDADAFRLVYRTVQPNLLRYVTALVGACEAEDVTSETWTQAVRDLGRFRGGDDQFRAWITTIGRHRALDHLRANGRRPVVETAGDGLPDWAAGDDVEQSVLESMSTAGALALIRSLPTEQAEAVLLRSVIGLDAKTAGKVLGKRAGAVRTAAYRGLRTLANRLEQNPAGRQQQRGNTFYGGGADEVE